MTPTARHRAAATARDILTLPRPHELEPVLTEAIAHAIEEAVLAEREAACRDACISCRQGIHVVVNEAISQGWDHVWPNDGRFPCEAGAIRTRGSR